MRICVALVALLAALVPAGCGGGEGESGQETGGVLGETAEQPSVGEPITFELLPSEGSGVSGTVTMQPVEDDRDRTAFSITIEGDRRLVDADPATIERGSCGALDAGEESAFLGDVVRGSLERGDVSLSMLELLDGDFAVVVRETAEAEEQATAIACADVPDERDVQVDPGTR